MPMQSKQDGASQENAYAPSPIEPLKFEVFQGINTATSRAGVDDKQMWYSDGWMPLAPRLLRTLPDVGTALWTPNQATGNDIYTKVMLHLDGTDTSTTITDSNAGGSAHTWTVSGTAQIDTAQFKFGGASALFAIAGDHVSSPDSTDFALGSGDWTVDAWFNCNVATGGARSVTGQSDAGFTAAGSAFVLRLESTGIMDLLVSTGSAIVTVSGTTVFSNTSNPGWHHVAAVRTGNVLKLFLDGVQEGGNVAFTGSVNNTATDLIVGCRDTVPNDGWVGWIDEFRLSVGIARWTANFVPPTAPYAAAINSSIVFFKWVNIGTMSVAIVFLADGSIYQVTEATGAVTLIAAAGTILDPAIENVGVTQWASDWIIIVADQTNGYWLWDGNLFYEAGTIGPNIELLNVGSGYTSAPTITPFGGSGSGASITAIEANGFVTGFSIIAVGSGYLANEVVGLAFGGGGITARTARLTAFTSNGALTTVSITDGGLGYTSAGASAAVVGGGGSGALLAISIASTSISFASLTAAGSGYSTKPTVIVTDANNPVALATVSVMPLGVQGTDVETYSGHVWVINGPTLFWTAPGSVQDFATSAGGGNASSADSYLRVGYTKLQNANGFLYLIADSSVNYISGVQTSGSPPTTTFSNQNADPEVGSPYAASVLTLDRSILFANSYGVHALSGSAVNKISEPLDGFWDSIPNFDGLQLSSAKATIFDKKVWMVLSRFVDVATGDTVNKLLMFQNGRWWVSGQGVDLIYVAGREFQSNLSAWGTDGTSIYPLFTTASANFTKRVQTKLWDAPGGYQFGKAATRFWSLFNFDAVDTVATVNVDIENEVEGNVNTYTFTSPSPTIPVINASSITIPTINASSTTITVQSIQSGYFVTDAAAIGQQGVCLGFTVYTTQGDIELISAMMQPEIVQYRG